MTDAQSLIRAVNDIDDLNTIARYRNRLTDIREWRTQLTDVMLTVSGYAMDLTGVRGTTDRIPGGDALAMLAPWAPDADHGDDLPHPDQIIREWATTIHDHQGNIPPARATWAQQWRFLYDQTPAILESPWAADWQSDIDALWHRLAALTGNAPTDTTQDVQRRLADCAHLIPDNTRMALADADKAWPGIRNRIDVDRSTERARARKEHRDPQHKCEPDDHRRYLVADLRQHYGATRLEDRIPHSA